MKKKLNILVEIGHPAHVHFFKNIIKIWKQKKHNIFIVSRDKDITNQLLKEMGYDFISLTKQQTNRVLMILELLLRWLKIFFIIKKKKIDIIISISGISTSIPGKLTGITTLTCQDTDDATFTNKIAFKFSDIVLVPNAYMKTNRKNIIKYKGFHELSYLHPNKYQPKKEYLKLFNLTRKEKFIVIRLVKLKALHDTYVNGITEKELWELITFFKKRNIKVLISTEREISRKFKKYIIFKNYDKLLYIIEYSLGYIGESPTMAMEFALRGRISIFISPRINKLGYIRDLVEKYTLIYTYSSFSKAFSEIKNIFYNYKIILKSNKRKLMKLINDKIDVADWIANFIIKFHNDRKI